MPRVPAAILALLLLPDTGHTTGVGATGTATVQTTVSTNSIAVSESVTLVIEASAPENDGLYLPILGGELGDFTIARSELEAQRFHPGPPPRISQKLTLLLHPGPPGRHRIPPLQIMTGGHGTVKTQAIEVQVTSVLPESNEPLEPRPHAPALADEDRPRGLLLLLIGLASGVLGLLAYRTWRALRDNARGNITDSDCAARALEALDCLPADAAPEEIHAVAVAYLSTAFGNRAAALSVGDRECTQRPALAAYLGDFDQARFARTPDPDADMHLRRSLRRLIAEETAP